MGYRDRDVRSRRGSRNGYGETAPPVVPPEFAYLGYHVEVDETPAGWVWRAWRRGKHEGAADLHGGPQEGPRAAVIAVKVSLTEVPG
jgi:hypothetical protein